MTDSLTDPTPPARQGSDPVRDETLTPESIVLRMLDHVRWVMNNDGPFNRGGHRERAAIAQIAPFIEKYAADRVAATTTPSEDRLRTALRLFAEPPSTFFDREANGWRQAIQAIDAWSQSKDAALSPANVSTTEPRPKPIDRLARHEFDIGGNDLATVLSAADHLLRDHDCDLQGYEVVMAACDRLRAAAVSPTGRTCELHHVHSETEPCSAVIDRWDAAWAEAAERDRHPDGPRNEMGRPARVETPRERAAREKRDANL